MFFQIKTPYITYKKLGFAISDESTLRQLGFRLAQLRLSKNLTQGQVAIEAGLAGDDDDEDMLL